MIGSSVPSLNVWMNGEHVGTWTTSRAGVPVFRYAPTWLDSPHVRTLSLSLPLTADLEIRGPVVDRYFDNLLPDNPDVRRRIRDRFALRSTDPIELLEAIGRDCVGAVQLLPLAAQPPQSREIEAEPLSKSEVERILLAVAVPPPYGTTGDPDDFRISIAGAQEKTALLQMGDHWFRPRKATPTTHILKLPLGIIGNFRGNFSHSVENEWLCSRFLRGLGLTVADTSIGRFGEQKVLVVRRFDRRWIGVDSMAADTSGFTPGRGVWIARLPQEDFCQATGRSPAQRYESEGGPSIADILDILARGSAPERDRADFVLAQLAFWLLAATDGHGKNFSIRHLAGGAFEMTPLYDVLSAWPVIGRGARQLSLHDAKLAMAVSGRRRHYKIMEIHARHWHALARRVGGVALEERMRATVESAIRTLDRLTAELPADFPEVVIERIASGVRSQARNFLAARPDE